MIFPCITTFGAFCPKDCFGFREDGGFGGLEPGTFFDITTPTWRLGEALLEGAYIAKALHAVDANLICNCRWVGLSGRSLVSRGNPNRSVFEGRRAEQDVYEDTQIVALDALPDALPELVFAILAPLYEFSTFSGCRSGWWRKSSGQRPRLGRTRRLAGSLRVAAHPAAVHNPAGRSVAHGFLQPPRPAGKRGNANPSSANSRPILRIFEHPNHRSLPSPTNIQCPCR
jgi:hypothetical protein